MIRETKHNLNYQTTCKTNSLILLFEQYQEDVNYYINLIWNKELEEKKFMSSKLLPINKMISSNWRALSYKRASEMTRGVKEWYKNQSFKINKLNLNRQEKNLKLIELPPLTMPIFNGNSIHIDRGDLIDINRTNNHFNWFVRIILPDVDINKITKYAKSKLEKGLKIKNFYKKINIPINGHKHSKRFKDWNRKGSIKLTRLASKNGIRYFLHFFYEKKTPSLKEIFKDTNINYELGIDIGYNKLISDSNGNHYGQELKEVYTQLSNKVQGSKAHKRLKDFKNQEINRIINSIDFSNVKVLYMEDLKKVKYKTKIDRRVNTSMMRKLQYWTYSRVLSKLKLYCEENGILLIKIAPAFTS